MDINTLRIIMTIISFAVFAGIVAWAIAPANRARFNEAALIPFTEDNDKLDMPGKGAHHG